MIILWEIRWNIFPSSARIYSLTTVNRLSLIIASLLRIVAPSVADISTAYAINNILPPTHRGSNVLRACVFTSHVHVARRVTASVTIIKNSREGFTQLNSSTAYRRHLERTLGTYFLSCRDLKKFNEETLLW